MKRIVLLRHAQAHKNNEKRHGGAGTSLTELGRGQAREFARLAGRYFPGLGSVYFVCKPQCEETANEIAASGWRKDSIEGLLPFNLGLLDGLSDGEARSRFPQYAKMIEDWRLGLIEIADVQIPGATNMQDFFDRGRTTLTELTDKDSSFLVVGTRSVLVMLWNVLKGHHPGKGGYYFERPWDNCEWVEFMWIDRWHEARTQRHRGEGAAP